jgi:hypothetical protein
VSETNKNWKLEPAHEGHTLVGCVELLFTYEFEVASLDKQYGGFVDVFKKHIESVVNENASHDAFDVQAV